LLYLKRNGTFDCVAVPGYARCRCCLTLPTPPSITLTPQAEGPVGLPRTCPYTHLRALPYTRFPRTAPLHTPRPAFADGTANVDPSRYPSPTLAEHPHPACPLLPALPCALVLPPALAVAHPLPATFPYPAYTHAACPHSYTFPTPPPAHYPTHPLTPLLPIFPRATGSTPLTHTRCPPPHLTRLLAAPLPLQARTRTSTAERRLWCLTRTVRIRAFTGCCLPHRCHRANSPYGLQRTIYPPAPLPLRGPPTRHYRAVLSCTEPCFPPALPAFGRQGTALPRRCDRTDVGRIWTPSLPLAVPHALCQPLISQFSLHANYLILYNILFVEGMVDGLHIDNSRSYSMWVNLPLRAAPLPAYTPSHLYRAHACLHFALRPHARCAAHLRALAHALLYCPSPRLQRALTPLRAAGAARRACDARAGWLWVLRWRRDVLTITLPAATARSIPPVCLPRAVRDTKAAFLRLVLFALSVPFYLVHVRA